MKSKLIPLAILLAASLSAETTPARSTAIVDGKTYPVYEVNALSRTSPDYPYQALKDGRGGTVTVGALVDEKGKVKKTYVEKSDAGKDIQTAVRNAVKEWKFPMLKESDAPIVYVVIVSISLELPSANSKAPQSGKPTLHDIISDPKYLNETMGTKVLLITDAKTGLVPDDLQKAVKNAKLDGGREFFPLPKGAIRPEAKVRGAPQYPAALRSQRVSGSARYLFFIGADGAVKGIYCSESSHPDFAIAGAAAVAKWRFTPAMIENTPVPVLVAQLLEFNAGY